MKKIILILVISSVIYSIQPPKSEAQSFELIGGNILNGAVTGAVLGTSTMALRNTGQFTGFRIGLGVGIIGGTAIAIYDIYSLPQGQEFFISGQFNDGTNSSIIILLDTMYGAAVGAALGTAVALIRNQSFSKGITHGAGAGAWVGFGFGMIDSFSIAERNRDFVSNSIFNRDSVLEFSNSNTELKMIQPGLVSYNDFSGSELTRRIEPALNVLSFRKTF